LKRTKEQLARLKDEAIEGLEAQLEHARNQLQALERRLEEGAKSVEDSTLAAAQAAQQALIRSVHRLEAQTWILTAKGKTKSAMSRANDGDFMSAEKRLVEAIELVRDTRDILGEDRVYDAQLRIVAQSLREAVTAVRAKADDVRKRIEQVMSEADTLVSSFESDDQPLQRRQAA
jgi:hypothetical protein